MRTVDKIEKLNVWVLAVKNYMKIYRGHVSDIYRNLNITELPIITSWYIKKKVKIQFIGVRRIPPHVIYVKLIYTGKPKGHWYL